MKKQCLLLGIMATFCSSLLLGKINMKKIVWVASTNRAKIEGAQNAFARMFPTDDFEVIGKKVITNFPEQPLTDDETLNGAALRLEKLIELAAEEEQKPDFYVAIEGGVSKNRIGLFAFSWAAVANNKQIKSYGRGASFLIPPAIAREIEDGYTMIEASKRIYPPESHNTNREDGLVSILSTGKIMRAELSTSAVTMALIAYLERHPV